MLAEKSLGWASGALSPFPCPLPIAPGPGASPGLGWALLWQGCMSGCFCFTLPAHPLGWSGSCPFPQPLPQALPLPFSPGHQHAASMGVIFPAMGKLKPLLLQKLLMAAGRGNPVFCQAGKQRRSPRPAQGTRSEGGDTSSFVSVNGLWLLQQWIFGSRSWVLGLAFCWVLFSLFRSPMKLGCLGWGAQRVGQVVVKLQIWW